MIKLTSIIYSTWKQKMKDIIFCKDMYDPMEMGDAKQDNVTTVDQKKSHQKEINLLRQWGESQCIPPCGHKEECPNSLETY